MLKFPNLNKKTLSTAKILLEPILLCYIHMKIHIFGYKCIIIHTCNFF